MRTPLVALVAITALAAVLGWTRLTGQHSVTAEHPVAIPASTRTVSVSRTMPAPSASPRHLSAMLEEGTMPTGKTAAEVMSDTECTPNAQMLSHCRNEMRLQDGSTIVVRHPHDMRRIPCLAPGERVLVIPSSA